MASVKIGHINASETGTVTAVSTNASYPLHRLYDRYWNINWKSGSTGTKSTTGGDLITNGAFTTVTTGWTTDNECTLSSVAGGQSGNALTINYVNNTDGSDFISNGTFETVVSPWAVGSSDYTASIVGSGYSGNAVNVNNSTIGTNLLTNPGFESALGSEWVAANGTIARHGTADTGTYAVSLTGIDLTANMISNGTMETGSPPTGWTGSGVTPTRSTTYYYTGVASLQCICSPSTDHVYQDVATTVGATYRISCRVRRSTSGNAALTVRTTAGVLIKQGLEVLAGTTWKRIEFFFTATETTTRVCLGLIAATFQYDDVEMYYVGTNLLTNPSFESGTTGWTYGSNTVYATNTSQAISGNCLNVYNNDAEYFSVSQTITGLTIGQAYHAYANLRITSSADGAWAVAYIDDEYLNGARLNIGATNDNGFALNTWVCPNFIFIATATSHTFKIISYITVVSRFFIDECGIYQVYGDLSSYNMLYDDIGEMEQLDLVSLTYPRYWDYQYSGTVTRSSTYSNSGVYSLSFASISSVNSFVEIENVYWYVPTIAGYEYTLSAYIRRSVSAPVKLYVTQSSSPGTERASVTQTVSSTAFTLVSVTFTATETEEVRIRVNPLYTSGSAITMYLDSVSFVRTGTSVSTNYPSILQTVTLTPGTSYQLTGRYRQGTSGDYSSGVSLIMCRGSNDAVYSYEAYTPGASYLTATKIFTVPYDETTMKVGFRRDVTTAGDSFFDNFTLYAVGSATQQYLEQTITGLTASKRYRLAGYVLKPTIADASSYIVGVYRSDTSAVISTATGTATTSWVAFTTLDFDCPSDLTSVKIRLIRDSSALGDIRWDSVSCYHLNYAPTSQNAKQTITTTSGYEYRLVYYVHDGLLGTPLSNHPYTVTTYNGSSLAVLDTDTGNTTSSWATPVTMDFTATSSSTIVELKKNSGTVGNIAFDTVSCYRVVTSYEDQWVMLNQASSPVEVDTLIIPNGHTLNGLTCTLQYSADGSAWSTQSLTTANPFTGISGMMVKYLSAARTANYWRLYITGSTNDASLPQLGEFYLTKLYTLVSQPKYDSVREGYKSNITRVESDSKKIDYIINGTHRKVYDYTLPYVSSAEKTQLETIRDACMHKKPFFMIDHQGNTVFVELVEDIYFSPVRSGYYTATLKLMESL